MALWRERPDSDQQCLASVLAHGERAVAAHERAIEQHRGHDRMHGRLADAAAARVCLATAASVELAKRPQSLAWLSAEA